MSVGSGLDWEVSYNGFSISRLPRYYTVYVSLAAPIWAGTWRGFRFLIYCATLFPGPHVEVLARENILHHNYESHTFESYSYIVYRSEPNLSPRCVFPRSRSFSVSSEKWGLEPNILSSLTAGGAKGIIVSRGVDSLARCNLPIR